MKLPGVVVVVVVILVLYISTSTGTGANTSKNGSRRIKASPYTRAKDKSFRITINTSTSAHINTKN